MTQGSNVSLYSWHKPSNVWNPWFLCEKHSNAQQCSLLSYQGIFVTFVIKEAITPLWEFVKKHSTRMKWVPGARYESPLNSDNKQVPKFLGKVQISPILCFVFWIIEDVLRYDVISARYVGCWYLFGITGKRSSIANYWSHSRKGGMLYQLLLTDSIGRVVVTFTTPLVNNFTAPPKKKQLGETSANRSFYFLLSAEK